MLNLCLNTKDLSISTLGVSLGNNVSQGIFFNNYLKQVYSKHVLDRKKTTGIILNTFLQRRES